MKRTTASTSAGATTRRPHMSDSRRIAVGVSGTGSNLRALAAAAERGGLGGRIELVFADRPCPALDWAAESGFETALVPGWRRCHARGDADRRRGRDRRPGGLHARHRAAGAGGVRRADPQRPPVAPAGLPGRPCRGRRAGPRRHGDRVHGPSRRPDARRRADPRPGGGPGRSRRRRGQPRHADPRGRAPAPAMGGRAPRLGRGGDRRAPGPGRDRSGRAEHHLPATGAAVRLGQDRAGRARAGSRRARLRARVDRRDGSCAA